MPNDTKTKRKRSTSGKRSSSKKGAKPYGLFKTFASYKRPGQIVPDRCRTNLRYVEGLAYRVPGSSADVYSYNLNSVFDPNLSGTGHQPMGFDQLKALYGRYRVYSCKYKVRFFVANVGPTVCAVTPTNETTSFVSIPQDALETTGSKYGSINNITAVGSVATPIVLSGKVNLMSLYGAKDMQSDRYQALISADPTETAILHLLCWSIDNQNLIWTFLIELEYDVEFYDRNQVTGS